MIEHFPRCTPAIPILRRLKDPKFKVNLNYTVISKPARPT